MLHPFTVAPALLNFRFFCFFVLSQTTQQWLRGFKLGPSPFILSLWVYVVRIIIAWSGTPLPQEDLQDDGSIYYGTLNWAVMANTVPCLQCVIPAPSRFNSLTLHLEPALKWPGKIPHTTAPSKTEARQVVPCGTSLSVARRGSSFIETR